MSLTPEVLYLGFLWYVVFLFSTVCHEAAHALMARRLGDSTAYLGGQASLNPVPHMQREPVGMILIPWVSYLLGGWMMGWASVPMDPYWIMRHPKKGSWVSIAGPLANFSLAIITAVIIRICVLAGVLQLPRTLSWEAVIVGATPATEGLATFLSLMFSLNLLLGLFNLVPVPPLDGYSSLGLFLSESAAAKLQEWRMEYSRFSFLGILVAWRLFDVIGFEVFWKVAILFLYA